MSAILDAALGYVDRCGAWAIFPADAKTKRPIIKTGTDHAEHATIDIEPIVDWNRRGMLRAFGMPTGAATGTVVIDADKKHDGAAKLAELESVLGPLPRTKVVSTQSGGLHIYGAHPGNGIRIRTGAGPKSPLGKLLCGESGVDVRGDGGIVILPPSCGYKWIADDDEPLPALPELWLLAIQDAGEPARPNSAKPALAPGGANLSDDDRIRRARAYLAKMPPAVTGEAGHNALATAVAVIMVGFDLDIATTKWLIASDYNPRCAPPWADKDLDHKIETIARSSTLETKLGRGYLLRSAS